MLMTCCDGAGCFWGEAPAPIHFQISLDALNVTDNL